MDFGFSSQYAFVLNLGFSISSFRTRTIICFSRKADTKYIINRNHSIVNEIRSIRSYANLVWVDCFLCVKILLCNQHSLRFIARQTDRIRWIVMQIPIQSFIYIFAAVHSKVLSASVRLLIVVIIFGILEYSTLRSVWN